MSGIEVMYMIEVNVNNITKYYGATLIFENVSFSVKTSERIGLIGPNGCGKTTLLNLLSGIDLVPGQGIDFQALARILFIVLALYAGSALIAYLQGWLLNDVVQSTVFRMRAEVERVLTGLGLS